MTVQMNEHPFEQCTAKPVRVCAVYVCICIDGGEQPRIALSSITTVRLILQQQRTFSYILVILP